MSCFLDPASVWPTSARGGLGSPDLACVIIGETDCETASNAAILSNETVRPPILRSWARLLPCRPVFVLRLDVSNMIFSGPAISVCPRTLPYVGLASTISGGGVGGASQAEANSWNIARSAVTGSAIARRKTRLMASPGSGSVPDPVMVVQQGRAGCSRYRECETNRFVRLRCCPGSPSRAR